MDYLLFDWAAMATTFLAVYMLGNHNRWGFVVFMISNGCWIGVGVLADSDAMIWGNAIFLVVNLRGWIKWKRDARRSDTGTHGRHSEAAGARSGYSSRMSERLNRALELHKEASSELLRTAEQITEPQWREPVAEGKWSPAELLEHLNNTYDVLLGELDGRAGMKIRTKPWQRAMLRLTMVPRIMKSGRFPRNAPAPKEVRPLNVPDREPALAAFRERAARLEVAATAAQPDQKLTHAYFGTSSVADGVTLCARHIQHHERQLKAVTER